MGTSEAEYAAFEEKVKRTVYLDNISPQVTESVMRTALSQFGNVKSVHFIPNYLESRNIPHCALVEMENPKQASVIVKEIAEFPFMILGMPRPVRARPAVANMFDERPAMPGRQIECHWLEPEDPNFEMAKKLKELHGRHTAEAAFLLKKQLEEEEKLAKMQNETLKANYKKYEMVDSVMSDGTARRLARRYNIRVSDD